MDDKRLEGPQERDAGVPRDLPDEQAGQGPDHWDADIPRAARAARAKGEAEQGTEAENVPDTDEAGTGRRAGPGAAGSSAEGGTAPTGSEERSDDTGPTESPVADESPG
ncbi:hypothetical protein [Streptomyces sp. NPDC047928]|uniref:hypothetical protein n=1 Tax=unclassified Streptomyces TaxID=2593676 RepID=UPI003710AE05